MEQKFYGEIKNILITARNKVYQTANFAMVEAYWNIGKSIIEEQGGNEKAEYGTGLLKELSKQMTQDFGKGFTVANLKNMRQFYLTFPNGYALRSELSWTDTQWWFLWKWFRASVNYTFAEIPFGTWQRLFICRKAEKNNVWWTPF